jgi:hypothetical protein
MVGCVEWVLERGGMRSGGGGGGRAAKCLEVCSENVRLPECNTLGSATNRLVVTTN